MGSKPLAALATPLALAVAGVFTAIASEESARRASTLFLVLIASCVLALLAVTARGRSRIVPGAALVIFAIFAFLPRAAPLPAAALAAVVAATLALSLVERTRPGPTPVGFSDVVGLVAAAQLFARAPSVFLEPASAATWIAILVPALVVGLLLATAARERPVAALALGFASFAAGPGWGLAGCGGVALGGLALVLPRLRRRPAAAVIGVLAGTFLAWAGSGPAWLAVGITGAAAVTLAPVRTARAAGLATLGAAAVVALVAGALPWHRARPLEAALVGSLEAPFRTVASPVRGSSVVLGSARPVFAAPIDVSDARALVVVSYLTNSAELGCDTPVARVFLEREGRDVLSATLTAGRETSEWAASRPDVARAMSCPPPPPAWSWIPASGRHLGSTYRARFGWRRGVVADRVRIERDPALPESTAVAIFRLGVER